MDVASVLLHQPQVFANEVTKIFEKDWFCVAHLSDVSENNSYITRRILDESIVIIRGKDAVLRAFYNVCPHRGHQILQGEGKAKNVLTCPYHAWSFRLDGAMVNAPNADKVCDFDAADFHLSEISVAEYAGFVFLNLDPQARPVEEQLPGFAEKLHESLQRHRSLKRVMRLETETPANWKTIVDNYQECYHCPTNHVSFADSVQVDHYEHLLFKNWSIQVGLARSSEKSFKIDSNIENPKFSGFYTWPCTMFNVAPSEDFMTVITSSHLILKPLYRFMMCIC